MHACTHVRGTGAAADGRISGGVAGMAAETWWCMHGCTMLAEEAVDAKICYRQVWRLRRLGEY